MNLHAATTADGRDRKQLERICRYLLRPPFAHDAVSMPARPGPAKRENATRRVARQSANAGRISPAPLPEMTSIAAGSSA